MLRLIHNRSIIKYALFLAGTGIALYFAWSAFPVGQWMGQHFTRDALGGPQVFGLIAALVMGALVLILFLYKEYLKEDAEAYSLARGDQSFTNSFKWFTWFVVFLEFASVFFRWFLIDWSGIGLAILAFGLVLMGLTYILSKQLHVQMNRPPSVAAKYMKNEARRSVFEEGLKLLRGKKLSLADKQRIGAGNVEPISRVRDASYAEREREAAAIAARQKVALDEQADDEKFYRDMVAPPADDPTPEPLELPPQSQNGHSRQPSDFERMIREGIAEAMNGKRHPQ